MFLDCVFRVCFDHDVDLCARFQLHSLPVRIGERILNSYFYRCSACSTAHTARSDSLVSGRKILRHSEHLKRSTSSRRATVQSFNLSAAQAPTRSIVFVNALSDLKKESSEPAQRLRYSPARIRRSPFRQARQGSFASPGITAGSPFAKAAVTASRFVPISFRVRRSVSFSVL